MQGLSNYGWRHIWGRKFYICGHETNWLVKTDVTSFVSLTRNRNVGLRGIYFYYIVRGKMLTNIHLIAYILAQTHASV